jgi:hypothetical protein
MTYFNVICQNFLGGPQENRVAGNPVSQLPVINGHIFMKTAK